MKYYSAGVWFKAESEEEAVQKLLTVLAERKPLVTEAALIGTDDSCILPDGKPFMAVRCERPKHFRVLYENPETLAQTIDEVQAENLESAIAASKKANPEATIISVSKIEICYACGALIPDNRAAQPWQTDSQIPSSPAAQ